MSRNYSLTWQTNVNILHKLCILYVLFSGGNFYDLGTIDGFNQWSNFIDDSTRPIRTIILVNIDEIRGEEALILNEWKIVKSKILNVI